MDPKQPQAQEPSGSASGAAAAARRASTPRAAEAGRLSEPAARLAARIETRTARVGVIGQGYVGLPLALLFAEEGFSVTGFDVDPDKVAALCSGRSYIRHIGAERVQAACDSGRFFASTDFDLLAE
jgi:hypothetical protein